MLIWRLSIVTGFPPTWEVIKKSYDFMPQLKKYSLFVFKNATIKILEAQCNLFSNNLCLSFYGT